MSTQNAKYSNKSATHNNVFRKALHRNSNNYIPLNSHFKLFTKIKGSKSNYIPLPTPKNNLNITSLRKKRIGQSSKEPGEPSHLNRFIHSFGGRHTKKRTRRHRKHHK
jgi:hypothetical protein